MTSTHMRKAVTKNSVRVIASLGVLLLTGMVFIAHAMTLGELQGKALIGRALDLSVPFQASQGDELSEGCVRADIYYGDAQQKSPRLTIQASQLRLQLAEPVNEPVVTVQLRTFCGASQIRNYVLLVDLPPDFSANVVANAPLPAAATPSDRTDPALAPSQVVLAQGAVAKTPKTSLQGARKPGSSRGQVKKTVKKQTAKTVTAKRKRKTGGVQPVKSVLKLDPMEILSDRMDNLELNMPFTPAEDALLQSRQIAALQADVKSMRDLTVKTDRTLLELRSQLELAQSQQQATTLLYGLIALLLLGVAGLIWLWRGQKKLTTAAQSWWQQPAADEPVAFLPSDVAAQANNPAPKVPAPVVSVAPFKINPDVVQDIRQQADFFVSLGQADRAIQILSQHIANAELPNPLICMDLLGIYQLANQADEFDRLRNVCRQHFNVQLPDLATFGHPGRDLVSYPQVMTMLTRLWPGEQALSFIDSCIFLKIKSKLCPPLDLAAFRDLLTLHTVAEELATPTTPHIAPAVRPSPR